MSVSKASSIPLRRLTVNYTLQFRDIWRNFDFFVEGFWHTLWISVVAMLAAVVAGTLIAVARGSKVKIFRVLSSIYVEAIRNTPLLIQIWLLYFGLGEIGIHIPALVCGLISLAINTAAYTAEILRAGFESVNKGIREAMASLGMTPLQTYRFAVFPLGFRAVLPSLCNMTIQCLLASSLLSTLGINELTNQATRIASKTFRSFESYIVIAVIYIFITLGITSFFALVTKKTKGSLH